jgi:hypothetical protein
LGRTGQHQGEGGRARRRYGRRGQARGAGFAAIPCPAARSASPVVFWLFKLEGNLTSDILTLIASVTEHHHDRWESGEWLSVRMSQLCHCAPRIISPFVFLWLSIQSSIGGAPTNRGTGVARGSRANKGTTFNIEMRLRHRFSVLRRHTNTVTSLELPL